MDDYDKLNVERTDTIVHYNICTARRERLRN